MLPASLNGMKVWDNGADVLVMPFYWEASGDADPHESRLELRDAQGASMPHRGPECLKLDVGDPEKVGGDLSGISSPGGWERCFVKDGSLIMIVTVIHGSSKIRVGSLFSTRRTHLTLKCMYDKSMPRSWMLSFRGCQGLWSS